MRTSVRKKNLKRLQKHLNKKKKKKTKKKKKKKKKCMVGENNVVDFKTDMILPMADNKFKKLHHRL